MPTQRHIDLTDKKALVAAFNKHHNDLWSSFGTAPLYKDYDPNNVINFIDSIIEKEKASISPQKKEEIFNTLKQKGKNPKLALTYIANVFLKGAGLGLNDSIVKEKMPDFQKQLQSKQKSIAGFKDKLSKASQNPTKIGPAQDLKKNIYKNQLSAAQSGAETIKLKKKQADKKKLVGELEEQLRLAIRTIIKEIIAEADSNIRYAEKQWDSQDSADEKNHFFKKFRGLGHPWNITTKRDEIIGKSFKELPKDVQKAWEYYIHKMK